MTSIFIVDSFPPGAREHRPTVNNNVQTTPVNPPICRRRSLVVVISVLMVIVVVVAALCFVTYLVVLEAESNWKLYAEDHSATGGDNEGNRFGVATPGGRRKPDVRLFGNTTVIYDYSHDLKVIQFPDVPDVCFVTELQPSINEDKTKEPNKMEMVHVAEVTNKQWRYSGNSVDPDLLPAIAKQICGQTVWIDKLSGYKGVQTRPRRADGGDNG